MKSGYRKRLFINHWQDMDIGVAFIPDALLHVFAVASLTLMISLPAFSTQLPSLSGITLPPASQLRVVANNVIHYGQLLSIAEFDSTLPIEQVVEFYQQAWQSESTTKADTAAPGMIVTVFEGQHLLSQFNNGINTVFQLVESSVGGTQGLLSIMDVSTKQYGQPKSKVQIYLDQISGFERLTSTESNDSGRLTIQCVYSSKRNIDASTELLRSVFKTHGWHSMRDAAHGVSRVLQFDRRDTTVDVVVSESGSHTAVIVLSEISHD